MVYDYSRFIGLVKNEYFRMLGCIMQIALGEIKSVIVHKNSNIYDVSLIFILKGS